MTYRGAMESAFAVGLNGALGVVGALITDPCAELVTIGRAGLRDEGQGLMVRLSPRAVVGPKVAAVVSGR